MKILNYGSMNIDNVYSVEHMARPGETILATAILVPPVSFCRAVLRALLFIL